jgi:sulfur transfer complex TusBCD TusB component (DsrH family)
MNDNWVIVFESNFDHIVQTLKSLLEQNGIKAIILNKKDSMVHSIGTSELYVQKDDVILAKHLLESSAN